MAKGPCWGVKVTYQGCFRFLLGSLGSYRGLLFQVPSWALQGPTWLLVQGPKNVLSQQWDCMQMNNNAYFPIRHSGDRTEHDGNTSPIFSNIFGDLLFVRVSLHIAEGALSNLIKQQPFRTKTQVICLFTDDIHNSTYLNAFEQEFKMDLKHS